MTKKDIFNIEINYLTFEEIKNLLEKLEVEEIEDKSKNFLLLQEIFVKSYPLNGFIKKYKKEIKLDNIIDEYPIICTFLKLIKDIKNEVDYLKELLSIVLMNINIGKINRRLIEIDGNNINIILKYSKKNKSKVILDNRSFEKSLKSNITLSEKKELIDLIIDENYKENQLVKEILNQYELRENLKTELNNF